MADPEARDGVSLVPDLAATWRSPATAMRRRIAEATEPGALASLMGASALIFVAQWPRLAREAYLAPEVPLDARIGGALLGWIFIVPLALYVVAAITCGIARLAGGGRNGLAHRTALFWALFASVPAWLLSGLVAGLVGQGAAMALTGALALGTFVVFWVVGLIQAERTGEVAA